MKKKIERIWILNHHANGNGDRHDAIAKQLKNLGVEVLVIASSYNHSEHRYLSQNKCLIQSRNNGVNYIWLRTQPAYKGNGISRILNMFNYMQMIKRYALEWCEKFGYPDVVVASSVHPFTWEAGYWVTQRTGADFYPEVRDLWPLSLIEVKGVNKRHPLIALFSLLEKRAYRRGKKIITTMPYAYKYISEKLGFQKDKVEWIPNGIDTFDVDRILSSTEVNLPYNLARFLDENWCAVYTGSIVESECVDYILDCAELLQDKGMNKIKVAIIGSGHLKNQMIEEAKRKNLKNVKFFERISKEQVALVVNKANVCLAAVRNLEIYKYGLSMNKLNDYLYSGKPTIFVCDVDNVVSVSGGGIALPYGNKQIFAEAIESIYNMSDTEKEIMGDKGRQIVKEQYDTNLLANKLLNIFESNREIIK